MPIPVVPGALQDLQDLLDLPDPAGLPDPAAGLVGLAPGQVASPDHFTCANTSCQQSCPSRMRMMP